jgi:DNA-binding SARP family transcriptional activator
MSSVDRNHDTSAAHGFICLAPTEFLHHTKAASGPTVQPAAPRHRLQACLLGPVELYRDNQLVNHPHLRRERVRQLLCYLAVHPRTTRRRAAAELWPELDDDAASCNLRVTLTYLRRLLEPDRPETDPPYFLRADGPALELSVGTWLTVDVREFDRHFADAQAAERRAALSLAITAYQRALALYRGDFCVGQLDAEWAELERDRIRLRYLTATTSLGELLLASGDQYTPLTLGHAALLAEPWSEAAYRLLIATHLARGEHAQARRTLVRCHAMLAELQAEPEPQTQMLTRRLSARPPQPRCR